MKIYLAFILLLSTAFPGYSHEKNTDLPYPELIPVLKNGLYGYCDKDMNMNIEPQFDWVTFFSEDPDFFDIKDPKKKAYGSNDYATVWQDGQKMRIDKKGKVAYRYHQEDFNEISPKESMNPSLPKQPFEKFQDDKTKLWGVRNTTTGDVLIPTQYPVIQEELYSSFQVAQYPLILVSSLTGESKFYVGLNGMEYRVQVNKSNYPDTTIFVMPPDDEAAADPQIAVPNDSASYPDLIPVLQSGLFGYCDLDFDVVIEPQFYRAEFFETDFSFQIYNVNDPDIVRFGTDAYAWVETGDNKRYRIDKTGNRVYHYKESDFKSDAAYISLNESEGFQITGIDSTTLLQLVNHGKRIDDTVFFEKTKLNELKDPQAGMLVICYPYKADLPLALFRDEATQLQGVKDMETGQVIIEAKYTMLDKLFGDMMQLTWHPFFRAYAPGVNSSFYVGLDGKEYVIRADQ